MDDRLLRRYDLTDHVALVTGAGSGIGRASAGLLALAGATVVCADIDESAATATATAIGGIPLGLDVADRTAVDAAVESAVADHGRLDVVANIAGVLTRSPILELTDEDLEGVLAVNFRGVLHSCQAAGRVMAGAGRGAIVNMASVAIDSVGRGFGAYAISKTAVAQLTRTLATELAPRGVRVNAVLPGWVLTGMTAGRWTAPSGAVDEAVRAEVLAEGRSSNPLGRIAEPDDIAHAVLYLATEASSYVTGQLLRVNGGSTMPW